MQMNDLQDLFVENLKDLYSAENQILKALPKAAKKVENDLILLEAPSFDVVAGWREEQEAKLRAVRGGGMTREEVRRFVAVYERLTRWILAEMPGRADWVVTLDTERNPYA